jgi:hypothetical protein
LLGQAAIRAENSAQFSVEMSVTIERNLAAENSIANLIASSLSVRYLFHLVSLELVQRQVLEFTACSFLVVGLLNFSVSVVAQLV